MHISDDSTGCDGAGLHDMHACRARHLAAPAGSLPTSQRSQIAGVLPENRVVAPERVERGRGGGGQVGLHSVAGGRSMRKCQKEL